MKKIWSTLDFFRKLLLTTQVQYRTASFVDRFSVAVFSSQTLPVKQKTHLAVRWKSLFSTRQHPLILCSGGLLLSFWHSFVGLGTISNIHNSWSVGNSIFFIDKNSPAIFFSTISWWKQGEKTKTTLFAADNSAEDQTGPTGTAEFQLTQASLLGHPHGHSAEATSVGSKGQDFKQVLPSSMTCPEEFKQKQKLASLFKLTGLRESKTLWPWGTKVKFIFHVRRGEMAPRQQK